MLGESPLAPLSRAGQRKSVDSKLALLGRAMFAAGLVATLSGCSDSGREQTPTPDPKATVKNYPDNDDDKFGTGDGIDVLAINSPISGYATRTGDCDDKNALTYPGAEEICDSEDNDCDGEGDENAFSEQYYNADGDTAGAGNPVSIQQCELAEGYSFEGADCNDEDASVFPGTSDCPKTVFIDETDYPVNCQDVLPIDNRPGFYNLNYNDDGSIIPVECLANGWTVTYVAKNGSNDHSEVNGGYYNAEACPDLDSACKRYLPDYVNYENNFLNLSIEYPDGASNVAIVSAGRAVFEYFNGNPGLDGWAALYYKADSGNFNLKCFPNFVYLGAENDEHPPIFAGAINDSSSTFWATYDGVSADYNGVAKDCDGRSNTGNLVKIAFQ